MIGLSFLAKLTHNFNKLISGVCLQIHTGSPARAKTMLQDIVRGTLQTIFRDKILLGLVIVGVIAIVSAGSAKDEKKTCDEGTPANGQQAQAQGPQEQAQQSQEQPAAAGQQAQQAHLEEAKLAQEFVSWWLGGAMNFAQANCQQTHADAFKWMNPEAVEVFKANFWTPEMEQAFSTGSLVAHFQPAAIEPKAINPDGSIVVSVDGTLVMQVGVGAQTTTQRVLTDYLVKKDKGNMRIAAMHAKTIAPFSTIPTY